MRKIQNLLMGVVCGVCLTILSGCTSTWDKTKSFSANAGQKIQSADDWIRENLW